MGQEEEKEKEETEEEDDEVKNALAAATVAAAAGSIAIVVEEDEKDEGDRRGMDDGTESVLRAVASCRLRFFGSFFISFPFHPPTLLLLLLFDDNLESLFASRTPRKLLYPSQSGSEIQP